MTTELVIGSLATLALAMIIIAVMTMNQTDHKAQDMNRSGDDGKKPRD